ncbi:hypothetical protein [Parasphingorhabdus halotolerans]|uniref:hypothetical protein n=1 Tax=Parasphingorhabdus halotolerans TaxID=2725558 RepID=UPI001FE7C28D|nr:hypothetical protein [Parasphingorhabdus halotolerans]
MRMGLRTGDIDLEEVEMIIVPHGTEHRPEALSDARHVLMLEPNSTLNTDDVVTENTVRKLDRI